jgi:hypothetical protein
MNMTGFINPAKHGDAYLSKFEKIDTVPADPEYSSSHYYHTQSMYSILLQRLPAPHVTFPNSSIYFKVQISEFPL